MKLKCLIFILLTLMCWPFSVNAEKLPTLEIGVENSWPPFANAHGEGISVDIVRAALEAVGQDYHLHVKPYARVLRDVESGVLGAGFNVSRQVSTESRFIFGERPLLQVQASFFYAADTAYNYHSIEDMPDKTRIALILGYEYGDAYERQRYRFQEFQVARQQQIVKMLLAGRVDVAIMFDEVANFTLTSMGLPSTALRKGSRNHISDIYMVFSRKNPDALSYARLLDQGLLQIQGSGRYQQLLGQQ